MKVLKEKLGQDVCNKIFFIHAILGCDTTSRLHGIGKGTSLVLLKKEQPRMLGVSNGLCEHLRACEQCVYSYEH